MEQTPLQEQFQPSSPPSKSPPAKPSAIDRSIVSVSAAVLALSFFMPWATFFGENLSGLEIQKHMDSYKLVWLLPAGALITLGLSLAGAPTKFVRQVAGTAPFVILAYSLNQFGSDLFHILSWGGWLALAAGLVLIVTPSARKPQPKA